MIRARVIVASNRAAAGVYADTSGPLLVAGLRELGCEVDEPVVVPDGEPVGEALRAARRRRRRRGADQRRHRRHPDGPHPGGDPRACSTTRSRASPRRSARTAATGCPPSALSRGLAGVVGRTLVVNLPGSTGGARDGLAVLGPILGARRRPACAAATTDRAAASARPTRVARAGDQPRGVASM